MTPGRWCFCLSLYLTTCSAPEITPTRPHHTAEGTFKNLGTSPSPRSFFSFLWMRANTDWVDVSEGDQVPRVKVSAAELQEVNQDQVIWLGHSCFLIQVNGLNILTDPVFSDRASPVSFAGPKRYTQPPISIAKLPEIHAVVISHNHYDHLDQESIELIEDQFDPHWYVPLKNGELLTEVNVPSSRVIELDWWDSSKATLGPKQTPITFTATPAQHWSARGLFDRNEMLWSSWVFAVGEHKVFFGGDTGYHSELFKDIGKRLGPFSLGVIPIGAYAPREFMHYAHVKPKEAVSIHVDVKSSRSLGAHWGTFPLTAEPVMDPPKMLRSSLEERGISTNRFIAPVLGAIYSLDNQREWVTTQ